MPKYGQLSYSYISVVPWLLQIGTLPSLKSYRYMREKEKENN
jgi:hypothetical protein